MLYVYNPEKAPVLIGEYRFSPLNYSVIREEDVHMIGGTPLILETDPNFPNLWGRSIIMMQNAANSS